MILWYFSSENMISVMILYYVVISWASDIKDNMIFKIIYDIMHLKLWYHSSESMISVMHDIMDLSYHRQYQMQIIHDIMFLRLCYQSFESIISTWYHKHLISCDNIYVLIHDVIVSPRPLWRACPMATKLAMKWLGWVFTLLHRRAWQRQGAGWSLGVLGRAWWSLGRGEERSLVVGLLVARSGLKPWWLGRWRRCLI